MILRPAPVVFALALSFSALAASRSVWDGVYTKEQAVRGRTAYGSLCARCHGDALLGGESSPPLVGEDFLDKWNGKTVGELVERTRKTMPSDGPGKISRRQTTDMIAYLLSENAYPAGKTELEPDPTVLEEIQIQPKP